MADVESQFDTLKRLLLKLKYSHPVDREKKTRNTLCVNANRICAGDTTELLPLIHYALLSFSKPLATFLAESGYDLYGKNDLRFTEGVYSVLRKEFKYNPVLQKKQFLTEKGYVKRKLMFVNDVLEIGLKKHESLTKEEQKKQHSLQTWEQTHFAKKIDETIESQKQQTLNNKKNKKPIAKTKSIPTPTQFSDNGDNDNIDDDDDNDEKEEKEIEASSEKQKKTQHLKSNEYNDENVNKQNNESNNDNGIFRKPIPMTGLASYDPAIYHHGSNQTMEINDPHLNPYLQCQSLIDMPFSFAHSVLPAIAEEATRLSVSNQNDGHSVENCVDSMEPRIHSNVDEHTPNRPDDEVLSPNSSGGPAFAKDKPILPIINKNNEEHSHGHIQAQNEILAQIMTRLDLFESEVRQQTQTVNARLALIEGKLRYLETEMQCKAKNNACTSEEKYETKNSEAIFSSATNSLSNKDKGKDLLSNSTATKQVISIPIKSDENTSASYGLSMFGKSFFFPDNQTIGSFVNPMPAKEGLGLPDVHNNFVTANNNNNNNNPSTSIPTDENGFGHVNMPHAVPSNLDVRSSHTSKPDNGLLPFDMLNYNSITFPYHLPPTSLTASYTGLSKPFTFPQTATNIYGQPDRETGSTNESMSTFMRTLQEKLERTDRLLESTNPEFVKT
ncbi:hypothetical protein RFI_19748 [Reticulomyxa filosa]|uniref:Centrosomal protein of 44 kDa n=1 Tax=Reticulomyxa filosa TaxID=46433 RepID=X6MWW2_RETFI|nr:hypothetical protein RFI_19748 [Reticulomyxa filosa]|eukprot:ETO17575.1 hypothetical protein RFI_19748 [Reticulomyxa filosa]